MATLSKDYLGNIHTFDMLSLPELLEARDLFHNTLISKPSVRATAIGRYLIRKEESLPPAQAEKTPIQRPSRTKPPRTLANSEVRVYSWPCVLVFVDEWISPQEFATGSANPENMVPKVLELPKGIKVPVCTVLAEPLPTGPTVDTPIDFSRSLLGGGSPVLAQVQGLQYVASVGCLVTDSHNVYALTNRHVTGAEGTPVYGLVDGRRMEIGRSSSLQRSRLPFEEVWGPLAGKDTYVNLDIGLITINDLNFWTAEVLGIGEIGDLVDISPGNISSLRLIGSPVRAMGAVSGEVRGTIHGLFYRYKAVRGFQYVADLLIGPRGNESFVTQHGDSGTLWLLETDEDKGRPVAVQWGGTTLTNNGQPGVAYALATSLSSVCDLLNVDLVRDINVGLPTYWGSVGHFTIASIATEQVSNTNLRKLMRANLNNITYKSSYIRKNKPNPTWHNTPVPLTNVPDVIWKRGNPRDPSPWARNSEGPNHFADMDRQRPSDNKTLLELCIENPANISVGFWRQYYKDVSDSSHGLLPFRIWQLYQIMVDAVKAKNALEFVAAAGVLAHYVGDACQPLHISYLYDGDPDPPYTSKKKGGEGVHSAYETLMVNRHIIDIIDGLNRNLPATPPPTLQTGKDAAIALVNLMQRTYTAISSHSPRTIVDTYIGLKKKYHGEDGASDKICDDLWEAFGDKTIGVMADGCMVLAMLWESAWMQGNGDQNIKNLEAVVPEDLDALYKLPDFARSYTLAQIANVLH